MADLQEKLEMEIRKTLKDPEGAGSDLSFVDEVGYGDEWLYVEGNLDVVHLASHVIETLGLDDYEYAMLITSFGSEHHVYGRDWGTLEDAQEKVDRYRGIWSLNGNDEHYTARIVKRRKAGKVENV